MRSRANIGADAALVLAAVARMHAADREGRETLQRLRAGLTEMAAAIGRAKAKTADTHDSDAAAKAVDTAAMLDELEHLVDGMIEIVVGESEEEVAPVADTAQLAMELPPPVDEALAAEAVAAVEAATIDQVPTVSGVVSRLDPDQHPAEPATLNAREMAVSAAAAGPTVEMLKSLVEALNASIPAESSTAHRMGGLSSIPATAEAAAQDVIQAFSRELTRGGAADIAHQSASDPVAVETAVETPEASAAAAPEVAAVETPAQVVQEAQEAQPDTAADTEPMVFDVLVEFDRVERQPEASTEAVEPAAECVEAIAPRIEAEPAESPDSATVLAAIGAEAPALPGPDAVAAAAEVPAPVIADTEAAVSPAEPVQPEAEPAVAEIAAEQIAAEPVLAEAAPAEAASRSIGEAFDHHAWAQDAWAEHALDDLPAMPYEASFEDTAAEPQPAVAALAEPEVVAVAEPTATSSPEPAAADAQPAQDSPKIDVVTYAVELLARFEKMESVPMLPPELGTAVIFQPRYALATPPADLSELPAPEAAAPEPVAVEPVAEVVTEPLAVAETESIVIAQPEPATEAQPESFAKVEPEPEPEAVSGDSDWTAEFKLPTDLLPTVNMDVAPEAEFVAPVEPATEIAALARPQPEAFPEPEPAAVAEPAPESIAEPAAEMVAEPAPETSTEPEPAPEPAPAPEIPAEPEIAAAAEPELVAAPEPAPEPEPVAEAVHETPIEAAAELPAVDLDAEFDSDDFLFGSNGEMNGAGEPSLDATADIAEAPADETVAPAAAKVAADPLMSIKAMSPDERTALFS